MNESKVTVITGAGSGIGRGIARIADERGMQLVLADASEAGLRETAAQLRGTALLVQTDVSDEASVQALAEQTFSHFEHVDLFFNNAGILRGGLSWEIPLAEWRRVLEVNVMGVVNCTHEFLPRMIAADRPCRIINTASIGGLISTPFLAPYNMSKFGVFALTEALAVELQMKNTKVAVSVLAPGAVRSNIFSDTRTPPTDDEVQRSVEGLGTYVNETGIDPDTFARWVFEGIDADQFWLIGDADTYGPAIEQRVRHMLAGINPEPENQGTGIFADGG